MARWLASPAGFLQAVVITVLWCVAIARGWDQHGFAFLFFATLISFVTQFTIAFQNEQAASALDLTLRNQAETMRLLVTLAKKLEQEQEENQDELLEKLEGLAESLDPEETVRQIRTAVEQ